jgi:predicted RNA-binding Zn-ribbon protein involved in translation (DUF1610 family)
MQKCPKCGEHLERIRRRPLDRLLSLFVKVHRYQCQNHHCQWEGVLRIHDVK